MLPIIWDKLSENTKELCIYLGVFTTTSMSEESLRAVSEQSGINLDRSLRELRDFGVLQQVTQIQEMEETVRTGNGPQTDWHLIPGAMLTSEEIEYLRIKDDLDAYHRDPEGHASWSEPRFRLEAEFKSFIKNIFSDLDK
jgi:hypothetical protein